MAYVNPTGFSLSVLPENRVRVDVDFTVKFTPTELRLEIPSRVYVKLMERDGARDETHLYAEWRNEPVTIRGKGDETAIEWFFGGWFYAGTFSSNTSHHFMITLDRDALPGEKGAEEWYCVLNSRPDIISDVKYTSEISADLA